MENEEAPKPPVTGVIYGRICFWIVIVGIIVAVVGIVMYFASDGYFDQELLLDSLWDGENVEGIWEASAGVTSVPHGHWYLSILSHGDVIAMLGIAICCFAAVVGMWGAFVATVRSGDRLYATFALIIAVILTCSAVGVLKIH
jgi:hypothetical protein